MMKAQIAWETWEAWGLSKRYQKGSLLFRILKTLFMLSYLVTKSGRTKDWKKIV